MFICDCLCNKSIEDNNELKTYLFDNSNETNNISQKLFCKDNEAKIMIELYNEQALNPILFNGQKCYYYVSPNNLESIALFPTFYISKKVSGGFGMKFAKYNLNEETILAIGLMKIISDDIDKINLRIQEYKYTTNPMSR
jgi:hypothetical protein